MTNKRYINVAEFQRLTGLSRPTIEHGCLTGQIRAIKTETGQWRIDADSNTSSRETATILEQLSEQSRMLRALAGHLGLEVENYVN